MAYTNSTKNLGLPQWLETDKPNWDIDTNEAFKKIDDYVGDTKTELDKMTADISMGQTDVDTINTALQAIDDAQKVQDDRIVAVEGQATSLQTNVTKLNNDYQTLGTKVDGLETSNQTLSDAVDDMQSKVNLNTTNITQLQTETTENTGDIASLQADLGDWSATYPSDTVTAKMTEALAGGGGGGKSNIFLVTSDINNVSESGYTTYCYLYRPETSSPTDQCSFNIPPSVKTALKTGLEVLFIPFFGHVSGTDAQNHAFNRALFSDTPTIKLSSGAKRAITANLYEPNGTAFNVTFYITVNADTGVATISTPPGAGSSLRIYFIPLFYVPITSISGDVETSVELDQIMALLGDYVKKSDFADKLNQTLQFTPNDEYPTYNVWVKKTAESKADAAMNSAVTIATNICNSSAQEYQQKNDALVGYLNHMGYKVPELQSVSGGGGSKPKLNSVKIQAVTGETLIFACPKDSWLYAITPDGDYVGLSPDSNTNVSKVIGGGYSITLSPQGSINNDFRTVHVIATPPSGRTIAFIDLACTSVI